MISKKNDSFFKKHFDVIFVFILILITSIFQISNLNSRMDNRVYDTLLRMSKSPKMNESVVIVDINDEALSEVGQWPWTRDILGDVLIRMKELGASTAVFDIEYVDPSTSAVEENLEQIMKSSFDKGEEQISFSIYSFADDISKGKIAPSNARASSKNVTDEIDEILYEMNRSIVDGFSKDNDSYFAKSIQFFGNASMTVNMRDLGIEVDEDDIEYYTERFLFDNVTDEKDLIAKDNKYTAKKENREQSFIPVLKKIGKCANGIGFTNVVVDKDGTRRRVELLQYYNGKYVGQLTFAPLVRNLQVESIERKKGFLNTSNCIILHNARLTPDSEPVDIKIPLDPHGRMYINWVHSSYDKSYIHVPANKYLHLDKNEELIIQMLKTVSNADLSELTKEGQEYIKQSQAFLNEYSSIQENKKKLLSKCRGFNSENVPSRGGISSTDYEEYFAQRTNFFEQLKIFVDNFEIVENYQQIESLVQLKELTSIYIEDFNTLSNLTNGKFCFIGNSASASTDLGATPFQERYPNVGTHANVINTIYQQDFITYVNPLWSLLFAFALSLIVILSTQNTNHVKKNLTGLIYMLVPILIDSLSFILFRNYIPMASTLLFCVILYFSQLLINFLKLEKDKRFLQRTFGSYVDPDYVEEIIKNEEAAELGGKTKTLTALFSDVKTFSGFTEVINNQYGEDKGAEKLVEILNLYLGALSNAILKNRGTIDKFVGDEIVSFFGAPLDNPNNAYDACVAALKMRQAENEFNTNYKDILPINPKTNEPFYLHSRIGLNTGNMVVGNMGTEGKLNYTVMGNNVNLASRLEGTNKVYNSWIMVSESTWFAANSGENKDKLVARKFDCVRVINVNKPVQIYNIIGFRDEISTDQLQATNLFNEGMNWYLKGSDTPDEEKPISDFEKAKEYFTKAKKLYPEDESSEVFIKRCNVFIKKGIQAIMGTSKWDGVFTMATK